MLATMCNGDLTEDVVAEIDSTGCHISTEYLSNSAGQDFMDEMDMTNPWLGGARRLQKSISMLSSDSTECLSNNGGQGLMEEVDVTNPWLGGARRLPRTAYFFSSELTTTTCSQAEGDIECERAAHNISHHKQYSTAGSQVRSDIVMLAISRSKGHIGLGRPLRQVDLSPLTGMLCVVAWTFAFCLKYSM